MLLRSDLAWNNGFLTDNFLFLFTFSFCCCSYQVVELLKIPVSSPAPAMELIFKSSPLSFHCLSHFLCSPLRDVLTAALAGRSGSRGGGVVLRRVVHLMEEEFLLHLVSCSIQLCSTCKRCWWNFSPHGALDSSALSSFLDTSKSLDSRINLEWLVHLELHSLSL